MEWIKQNKIFTIALVVSLLAIGGSGYFAFASWQTAKESAESLRQQRDKWERLERSSPHPGTTEVDNIALAQEDQLQITTVFDRAKDYMTMMPYLGITNDRAMRGFIENEVYDLTEMALLSGVALPEGYNFSFDGPLAMFNYETNSIPKLQFHVANVSMLSRLLYDIKVHSIEAVKRPRIDESDDFSDGIIDAQPKDADFYVRTPYELVFKGFSREFGEVLENFANARDCIVVKAMSVEATDLPVRKKVSEEKKKLRRRPRQVNPYAGMNPYGMPGMMGGAYGGANPYGGAMGGGAYGGGMRGDAMSAYGGMGGAYGSPYGGMGGAYGANPYMMGGGGSRSRGVETVETDTTFDEEIEEKPLEIRIYLDLLQLKPEDQPEYVQAILLPPPEGDAEGIEEDEDEDEDDEDA